MQLEEVDRKAIKAKQGPGVHSSFTLLLGLQRTYPWYAISISLSPVHAHTHTHTRSHILSTSCSSSVPSELFLGAELSRLKETVHLNVHNLLSEAHSWSHCSPVAPQRSSQGETERKNRFYPGGIRWPGRKRRLVKARQSESFRYARHLSPGDRDASTCFHLVSPPGFLYWKNPNTVLHIYHSKT